MAIYWQGQTTGHLRGCSAYKCKQANRMHGPTNRSLPTNQLKLEYQLSIISQPFSPTTFRISLLSERHWFSVYWLMSHSTSFHVGLFSPCNYFPECRRDCRVYCCHTKPTAEGEKHHITNKWRPGVGGGSCTPSSPFQPYITEVLKYQAIYWPPSLPHLSTASNSADKWLILNTSSNVKLFSIPWPLLGTFPPKYEGEGNSCVHLFNWIKKLLWICLSLARLALVSPLSVTCNANRFVFKGILKRIHLKQTTLKFTDNSRINFCAQT